MVCIAIWYNNVVMIPEHNTDDYKKLHELIIT